MFEVILKGHALKSLQQRGLPHRVAISICSIVFGNTQNTEDKGHRSDDIASVAVEDGYVTSPACHHHSQLLPIIPVEMLNSLGQR